MTKKNNSHYYESNTSSQQNVNKERQYSEERNIFSKAKSVLYRNGLEITFVILVLAFVPLIISIIVKFTGFSQLKEIQNYHDGIISAASYFITSILFGGIANPLILVLGIIICWVIRAAKIYPRWVKDKPYFFDNIEDIKDNPPSQAFGKYPDVSRAINNKGEGLFIEDESLANLSNQVSNIINRTVKAENIGKLSKDDLIQLIIMDASQYNIKNNKKLERFVVSQYKKYYFIAVGDNKKPNIKKSKLNITLDSIPPAKIIFNILLGLVKFLSFYPKEIKEKGKGIIALGADREQYDIGMWVSAEILKRHMMVLGTTGSGKTEFIMSLAYQSLLNQSGFCFIDGKGDIKTYFQIYSMARSLGREDDVLVLNYTTGEDERKFEKVSNTLNIFQTGSADTLIEKVSTFMGESAGDNKMWMDRAKAGVSSVLRALCNLRDKDITEVSVSNIRKNFTLERFEHMAYGLPDDYDGDFADYHKDLDESIIEGFRSVLRELSGWSMCYDIKTKKPKEGDTEKQSRGEAEKQFGFLNMQLTGIWDTLENTFGHVTHTELSEVNLYDVITNRRILYVLLPSMEKSADTIKKLGQKVVTEIRMAIIKLGAGSSLSGTKEKMLDARAVNYDMPFLSVLDEYPSYPTQGTGDLAAQARSYNISMMFGAQDYTSLIEANKAEAERIEGNTNLKVIGKLENKGSLDFIVGRGQKTLRKVIDGYNINDKNKEIQNNVSLKEVDKIDPNDILQQTEGQWHVLIGNEVYKIQSYYLDTQMSYRINVNHFSKGPAINLDNYGFIVGTQEAYDNKENVINEKNTKMLMSKCIPITENDVFEYEILKIYDNPNGSVDDIYDLCKSIESNRSIYQPIVEIKTEVDNSSSTNSSIADEMAFSFDVNDIENEEYHNEYY